MGTQMEESLFNLGMQYLVAAREVAFQAVNSPQSLTLDRNWWFMLENGPRALYSAYFYSLNLQVSSLAGPVFYWYWTRHTLVRRQASLSFCPLIHLTC